MRVLPFLLIAIALIAIPATIADDADADGADAKVYFFTKTDACTITAYEADGYIISPPEYDGVVAWSTDSNANYMSLPQHIQVGTIWDFETPVYDGLQLYAVIEGYVPVYPEPPQGNDNTALLMGAAAIGAVAAVGAGAAVLWSRRTRARTPPF